jgi:cyclic pyranopterin phosphate synthase
VLLPRLAQRLRDAGLGRVTVSLDALDEPTFQAMNDVGMPLARVLEGIDAAVAAGFRPIKLNTVVRRSVNEHALVDLARFARAGGHVVRFIEYMDVGTSNGWRLDDVVPAAEILQRVGAELPLEPVPPRYPGEVANRWRYRDGGGEIGVIASVTQPFCRSCTRARLSTDGKLYTCLFAAAGHDLRALLRGGAGDGELVEALAAIWSRRGDRYSEQRSASSGRRQRIEMSYIGG